MTGPRNTARLGSGAEANGKSPLLVRNELFKARLAVTSKGRRNSASATVLTALGRADSCHALFQLPTHPAHPSLKPPPCWCHPRQTPASCPRARRSSRRLPNPWESAGGFREQILLLPSRAGAKQTLSAERNTRHPAHGLGQHGSPYLLLSCQG